MYASTKFVDKLEGVEKFHAWKYRIGLVLEENDLAKFVKGEIRSVPTSTTRRYHTYAKRSQVYQNSPTLQIKQNTKMTQLGPKESLHILSKTT